MATRANIITIDDRMMYLTYNHYDGYPENLGKALETHYNTEELASKISREGYISYVDDETGEISVSNPADKNVEPTTYDLGGQDIEGMAYILAKEINATGADYAYIWNQRGDNWVTIKNSGIKSTMDQLENELPTMGFDVEQDDFTNEEKDYMTEWQSFLKEESFFKDDPVTVRWEKVRDNAYRMLKNEPGRAVNDYVDALERQITKMPSDLDDMIDWEADDFSK